MPESIIYNTRERAVSGDWNDTQAMATRVVADLRRYAQQQDTIAAGANPTAGDVDRVLGGLVATPSGSDVVVSAGALAQFSTSIVPAPGTYDSPERLAINRVATTLAAPAPGADTYYLLEAQMSDVVTVTTTRDVWDPGLGAFVPTSVSKVRERQIVFQFTAGTTTTAPATTAGWVPIAIVFRASGGGAVSVGDIHDVRPLPTLRERVVGGRSRVVRRYLRTSAVPGSSSPNAEFAFEAVDRFGNRLWARTTAGAVDLTALPSDGSPPGAAGTIWYLYLAAPGGRVGIDNLLSGVAHKGVLFTSTSGPNLEHENTAGISVSGQPAGNPGVRGAVCVGAVFSDGAGGFYASELDDAGGTLITRVVTSYSAAPAGTGLTGINLAGEVPSDAKAARVLVEWGGAGAGAGSLSINNAGHGATVLAGDSFAYSLGNDYSAPGSVEAELPVAVRTDYEVNTAAAGTQPATLQVSTIGWRY